MITLVQALIWTVLAASGVTLVFYLVGIRLERVAGRRRSALGWHVVLMTSSVMLLVGVVLSMLASASPTQIRWLAISLALQSTALFAVLVSNRRRFARPARRPSGRMDSH